MQDWHQLRRQHVGGSEIAALFGESPYMTAFKLWHQKRGSVEAENLDDNERVQAGRFLEAGVMEWANYKWGMNFYRPDVYVKHPGIVGMGCTPDAFHPDGIYHQAIIAQIKNVDSLQFAREWEADGDTITKAPLHILLQVQHEIACCEADESWLIVLVGGNRLYRMMCPRDDETIRLIESRVAKFWVDTVPPPNYLADGDTIRSIRKRLPTCEHIDLSDDDELDKILRCLRDHAYYRKINEDRETIEKNKLIHLYGEYERIKCNEFTATIKPDKNGHIRVWLGTETVTI